MRVPWLNWSSPSVPDVESPTRNLKALGNTLSADEKFRLIRGLAHEWGFRLHHPDLLWPDDSEFIEAWRAFPDSKNPRRIHERRWLLWNLSKQQAKLGGSFAECGVFRGAGAFLMLDGSKNDRTPYFGFDSFRGLSGPRTEGEGTSWNGVSWQEGDMESSLQRARSNLEKFADRVTLVQGWIPECFDGLSEEGWSLVHIDVDLYQPTLASLEFFAPRVVTGGLVLVDDYGFRKCMGAREAVDEFAAKYSWNVLELPSGQALCGPNGVGRT